MEIEQHERSLLEKTHGMVKEIYTILFGTEDYKEASVMHQLNSVKKDVKTLNEDKIKRDATIKAVGFLSGAAGTLVGGIIVGIIVMFIQNFHHLK